MEKKDYPITLSVKDVQEILGIGRGTAYELTNRDDFPCMKVGKVKRIPRDKFFEWMEQQYS